MDASLVQLMEELVASIEQRDAGDPDAPAWEAAARIRRLEWELAERLGDQAVVDGRPGVGPLGPGALVEVAEPVM